MIDKKTVEYVAKLAKINIEEEQKDFLASQLSKIINYIDKLRELNVDGIEPMRELHESRNVFRQDIVKPFTACEDILKNSPSREGNYFKIPKVID